MTGLHTVCRRVNCVGIICHLFITQAISLALFIFQQDPGRFNHTECRLTVLCHHYFRVKSRKLAHLCSVLQMLKLE